MEQYNVYVYSRYNNNIGEQGVYINNIVYGQQFVAICFSMAAGIFSFVFELLPLPSSSGHCNKPSCICFAFWSKS